MTSRLRSTFATLIAASALTAAASAQVVCTQSTDNVTVGNGGVACVTQTGQYNAGNSFIRRYTFPGNCTIPANHSISAVHFGIELAVAGPAGAGMQPANVRLYSIAPAAQLLFGNMTLLHDEPWNILDTASTGARVDIVPLSTQISVPAGTDIVVEVLVPDGIAAMHVYFPGSNGLGQSAPSYIASTGCGIGEPTDYNLVGAGFPNVHLIIDLEFSPPPTNIGTNYCQANPNSTGATGQIDIVGSAVVANNNVRLRASNLPLNAFGFFLNSRMQGFIATPGTSQGNICLGNPIGRFQQMIQNTGTTGGFEIMVDLGAIPTPAGNVAVMAGDTWNFQAWHRDVAGGTPTSNFTNGVTLVFQ